MRAQITVESEDGKAKSTYMVTLTRHVKYANTPPMPEPPANMHDLDAVHFKMKRLGPDGPTSKMSYKEKKRLRNGKRANDRAKQAVLEEAQHQWDHMQTAQYIEYRKKVMKDMEKRKAPKNLYAQGPKLDKRTGALRDGDHRPMQRG